MPESIARDTELVQTSSILDVKAYGGHKVPILACIRNAHIQFGGRSSSGTILISELGSRPIFGMDYLRQLDFIKSSIPVSPKCMPITCGSNRFSASFCLKKDASMDGMRCAARSLPFSMKIHVETEIRRLLAAEIIYPAADPVISTPVVPVVKQVGADRPIRLCGDYSRTLNRIIDPDAYNLPTIEQILQKVAGASVYSVLDLEDAYLQVALSEESQLFTCVSTHLGYFAYRRLQFSISAAPLIFQEIVDKVLSAIDGLPAYQDNTL